MALEWTPIIVNLLGLLAAVGGIGGIFHVRETRRAKRLENDKAVANEWKELYERAEQKSERLGEKLDAVFAKLREEQEEKHDVKVELARAKILYCDKTPCVDRHPPFGYSIDAKPDK